MFLFFFFNVCNVCKGRSFDKISVKKIQCALAIKIFLLLFQGIVFIKFEIKRIVMTLIVISFATVHSRSQKTSKILEI